MIRQLGVINVPTPGTPVRISTLLPSLTEPFQVHAVLIQVRKANTGRTYVGNATMNRTTEDGVLATLAIPTDNSIPAFSAALTPAPNGINLTEIWIDADVANEGVKVSVLIA